MSEEIKKEEVVNEQDETTEGSGGFLKKIFSSKKWCISIISVAVVFLLISGFVIYASTYDDIFPGVIVNGIDVGGMSIEEAEKVIQAELLSSAVDRTILLKCEDNEKEVSVRDLVPNGVNAREIANQAYEFGRTDGWFSMVCSFTGSLFGEDEVKASIGLNQEMLDEVIAELSAEYAKDVKETEYFLEGETLTIMRGKGGRCVNMEKAIQLVSEALIDSDIKEITFVVEPAEPKDVDIDEFYALVTQPAQDATYKKENGQIVIVDEVDGIIVEKSKIEEALKSGEDKVEIKVKVSKASKTAEDLKKMLFKDVMGEFSSDYSTSSAARANNVELATKRMNGTVLLPGEVFSYDQTIGRRTAENGYQMAGVYVGNRSDVGIGGGICQPSSTLYGAVLYANLEIVTRTAHSLPVAYVPAGQDATIAQDAIDFQFKNNTEYPVKIVATCSNRKLVCQIVGVKPDGQEVELVHTMTGTVAPTVNKIADSSIPKGYKKTVSTGKSGSVYASSRIVKVNGSVVKTEQLTNSRYSSTNSEVRVNPADMGASPASLIEYTGQVVVTENTEKPVVENKPPEAKPEEKKTENKPAPSNKTATESKPTTEKKPATENKTPEKPATEESQTSKPTTEKIPVEEKPANNVKDGGGTKVEQPKEPAPSKPANTQTTKPDTGSSGGASGNSGNSGSSVPTEVTTPSFNPETVVSEDITE